MSASSGSGTSGRVGTPPVKRAMAKAAPTGEKASPAKAPAKKAPAGKGAAKKAAVASNSAGTSSAASSRGPSPAAVRLTERDVKQSKPWKGARKRAEGVLKDPERMRKVAQEASDKSQGRRSGPMSKILDQVSALIRLVVAYARGNYREVTPQAMVTIIAGLIYFVSPLDLVPDFLPGGFVDDTVVLGWVIRTVKEELDAFMEWELGRESGPVE